MSVPPSNNFTSLPPNISIPPRVTTPAPPANASYLLPNSTLTSVVYHSGVPAASTSSTNIPFVAPSVASSSSTPPSISPSVTSSTSIPSSIPSPTPSTSTTSYLTQTSSTPSISTLSSFPSTNPPFPVPPDAFPHPQRTLLAPSQPTLSTPPYYPPPYFTPHAYTMMPQLQYPPFPFVSVQSQFQYPQVQPYFMPDGNGSGNWILGQRVADDESGGEEEGDGKGSTTVLRTRLRWFR